MIYEFLTKTIKLHSQNYQMCRLLHYAAQNAHTFPCLQSNDQQRVSELILHDGWNLYFHLKNQLYYSPSNTPLQCSIHSKIQRHFTKSRKIRCEGVPIVLYTYMLSINTPIELKINTGYNIYIQSLFYVTVAFLNK